MRSKKQPDRLLLGMTQLELAAMLGISREQVALYETGRRSLPMGALVKLSELLSSAEVKAEKRQASKPRDQNQEQLLKKLLLKNEYQISRCRNMMSQLQKRLDAQTKLKQISSALSSRKATTPAETLACASITAKASKCKDEELSAEILKLEIHLEVLKFERKVIHGRMGNESD